MRNYEHEIIELLKSHGNCIDGFNNLQEWGDFHPNTLVKYLKIMKKKGSIEITELNKQKKRYCIPDNDFAWSGGEFYDRFNQLKSDLDRKDIVEKEHNFLISSMIRLAFQTIANVEVYQLYEKYVNYNSKTDRQIELFKKRLRKQVDLYLQFLPVNDKLKVLTSLITKPSKPIGLNEYRRTSSHSLQ